MDRVKGIKWTLIVAAACLGNRGVARAQEPLVSSMKSDYEHRQIFKIRYTNRTSRVAIVSDDHTYDPYQECTLSYSKEPVSRDNWVDITIRCKFHFVKGNDKVFRQTKVILNVETPDGKTQIPLRIDSDGTTFSLRSSEAMRLSLPSDNIVHDSSDLKIRNSPRSPKLVLSGPSCDLIYDQIHAIQSLALKLDGKSGRQEGCLCDWKKAKSDQCEVIADSVLPKALEGEINLAPVCNGPNCFNTSLRLAKLLPNPRYTDAPEMKNWLSSPLCTELGAKSKPSPGDIIAIRDAGGNEVHGFTYLTPRLSYSKNGLSKGQPYQFSTPEDVFKEYKVGADCWRYDGKSKTPAGCQKKSRAQYYHCISFEDFKKKLLKKHPEVAKFESGLEEIDQRISRISVDGCAEFGHILSRREVDSIGAIVKDLAQFRAGKSADPDLKFYENEVIQAAKSLQIQLYHIGTQTPVR